MVVVVAVRSNYTTGTIGIHNAPRLLGLGFGCRRQVPQPTPNAKMLIAFLQVKTQVKKVLQPPRMDPLGKPKTAEHNDNVQQRAKRTFTEHGHGLQPER